MSNYCNCNHNAPKKIGSSKTNPPKIHEDDKVLVKNACATQLGNPITNRVNAPLEIATINLELDDFKRPSVLVEVSGQLVLTTTTAVATTVLSSFRLVRTCNGVRTVISQNSSISQTSITTPGAKVFDSFDFKFCDCSSCCDCVVYSIEYISDVALPTANATLSINNVCLQAIVTEAGPCTCCCCCC